MTASAASCEPFTVAIPTRDRGAAVVGTVTSLLASRYPRLAVIVVDQSRSDATAEALKQHADPRVTYIRSTTVGISAGRNIGLEQAQSELVAFTDDDCEVPPDWVERLSAAMHAYPSAAVGFCCVRPGPFDPKRGFIPTFERAGTRLLTDVRQRQRDAGIGAGMVVRRSFIQELGGFDELLGAGAPLGACEDGDIVLRALMRGRHVLETDITSVVHHGFRTYAEGRPLARRNWLGIGAASSKPLKCRHWRGATIPFRELSVAVTESFRESVRARRPRHLTPVVWFLRGVLLGLKTPLDRETLCFRARPAG